MQVRFIFSYGLIENRRKLETCSYGIGITEKKEKILIAEAISQIIILIVHALCSCRLEFIIAIQF